MSDLVIGLGNLDRGDDAAGVIVARTIQRSAPDIEVRVSRGDPAEIIEASSGRQRVVLIDACVTGGEVGRVHRFDVDRAPLPEHFRAVSTHGVGLGKTIETARILGALPDKLVVYGIEGERFGVGAAMTPAVRDAANALAAGILREFQDSARAARFAAPSAARPDGP